MQFDPGGDQCCNPCPVYLCVRVLCGSEDSAVPSDRAYAITVRPVVDGVEGSPLPLVLVNTASGWCYALPGLGTYRVRVVDGDRYDETKDVAFAACPETKVLKFADCRRSIEIILDGCGLAGLEGAVVTVSGDISGEVVLGSFGSGTLEFDEDVQVPCEVTAAFAVAFPPDSPYRSTTFERTFSVCDPVVLEVYHKTLHVSWSISCQQQSGQSGPPCCGADVIPMAIAVSSAYGGGTGSGQVGGLDLALPEGATFPFALTLEADPECGLYDGASRTVQVQRCDTFKSFSFPLDPWHCDDHTCTTFGIMRRTLPYVDDLGSCDLTCLNPSCVTSALPIVYHGQYTLSGSIWSGVPGEDGKCCLAEGGTATVDVYLYIGAGAQCVRYVPFCVTSETGCNPDFPSLPRLRVRSGGWNDGHLGCSFAQSASGLLPATPENAWDCAEGQLVFAMTPASSLNGPLCTDSRLISPFAATIG